MLLCGLRLRIHSINENKFLLQNSIDSREEYFDANDSVSSFTPSLVEHLLQTELNSPIDLRQRPAINLTDKKLLVFIRAPQYIVVEL
jgi:predicted Zn-dependent protease